MYTSFNVALFRFWTKSGFAFDTVFPKNTKAILVAFSIPGSLSPTYLAPDYGVKYNLVSLLLFKNMSKAMNIPSALLLLSISRDAFNT